MFSIITPTYNRAHTLERVFSSLLHQTDQDFEWVIVDDASTDKTSELIAKWQKQGVCFDIQYHLLTTNKGKPNALNIGLEYCNRPITIIADSDDSFVPETLAQLRLFWDMVNISDTTNKIATIWSLVKNEKNELVGEPFPHNFWQVNLKERVLKRKKQIAGEKWHSWRTSILRKYKMFHSEYSFISESATWNRINKDHDFLCINIFHRTYYSSQDGLIQKNKSRLELEKLKFYNAYYQLYNTSIRDIFRYPMYHGYAFDYLKSLLYYKKRDVSLSKSKTLCCLLISIIRLPLQVLLFIKYKNK